MAEPRPVAFVAGATGFTGRAIAAQDADALGVEVRLQVRPESKSKETLGGDPRIVEVGLDDSGRLAEAMRGADAVLQLIGTVRARFDALTSYESVDYGTTLALLEAAKAAKVSHFLLLSSVGAGLGWGSYLSWKKRTEEAVRESGLSFTIVRPSYLAGDAQFPERLSLGAVSAFLRGFSDTPFGGWAADLSPINIQILARVLLTLVKRGPQRRVLRGRDLWRIAREERLYSFVR